MERKNTIKPLLHHLFYGGGLLYIKSPSWRRWLYPAAFVVMVFSYVIFSPGDLDYFIYHDDIIDDSNGAFIGTIGLFIYIVGFIETYKAIEIRSAYTERENARKVYRWLWWSPLLTVPTLLIGTLAWYFIIYDYPVIPGLLPALWHLVLLKPARNKESALIRWHGRQALALAGLQTTIFLVFASNDDYFDEPTLLISIAALIWLVGNIWGQRQARRGDCSLARWLGHGDELPGPEEVAKHPISEKDVEFLMRIIRFSDDQEQRASALEKLKDLGMVEDL